VGGDASAAWELVRHLIPFLRAPLGLPQAHEILRARLASRSTEFLALIRRRVYDVSGGPYRTLLDAAGCTYGDVEALVRREGLEGALRELARHGVYLTVDEFKGRRPVRRGSLTFETSPETLWGRGSSSLVATRTSGSRGTATIIPIDLAFIRDRAVNTMIALAARGGLGWRHAIWGVPGGSAIVRVLEFSAFGARPARWFSQLPMDAPGLHPRYRWSARAIRWASVVARAPVPGPEHVPFGDPAAILRWLTETKRTGAVPHLHTFASSVVQICEAARAAGLDLRGTEFTLASEPTTAARLAAVRSTGAGAQPCYAAADTGVLGYGCLEPRAADDIHVFHDLVAMIQADEGTGLPEHSLLVTSLRPAAPLALLNVSLGDRAVRDARPCGCPLEAAGWTEHLHSIRSFEKLTAGGMTFLDTDLVRVLEEALPARFGGGPTDYQLVEEEAAGGGARLRLVVHPRVGPLDATQVIEAFLASIGRGTGVEKVVELAWRDASLLALDRREPHVTALGKVLHLYADRRKAAASTPTPPRQP
jgi:hypothetical protein